MDSTAGPLNQLISDALAVIAPHVPRDLTWPILLLTAGLATTIWLFRNGVAAKGADGRVRKMPQSCWCGVRNFLTPFPHRRSGGMAEDGKSLQFAWGALP